MSCCNTRSRLLANQKKEVRILEEELVLHVEDGNEYYAALTRDALVVAKCSTRLIHKHTNIYKEI